MRHLSLLLLSLVLLVFLSSCGGGGGSAPKISDTGPGSGTDTEPATKSIGPSEVKQIGLTQGSGGGVYLVRKDGSLWVSGSEFWESTPHLGLKQIESLSGVKQIAATGYYALALLDDGTLWGWGSNGNGNLGDVALYNTSTPTQISGLPPIKEVDADDVTIAVDVNGNVWTWGRNWSRQLGTGNTGWIGWTPEMIPHFADIVTADCSTDHCLAVDSSGNLWGWGDNSSGQLGVDVAIDIIETPQRIDGVANVVDVATYFNVSMALTESGELWVWGSNYYNHLGDGRSDMLTSVPKLVAGIGPVVSVSTSLTHTLAVSTDGSVWGWGFSVHDKFGTRYDYDFTYPHKVDQLPVEVAAVSAVAGYDVSFAFDSQGLLWGWGDNTIGHLDLSKYFSSRPIPVPAIGRTTKLFSSGDRTVTTDNNGYAWNWGQRIYSAGIDHESVPHQLPATINFDSADFGANFSVVKEANGSVWTIGVVNPNPAMPSFSYEPVLHSFPVAIDKVAAGGFFTLFLDVHGNLWGYGSNYYHSINPTDITDIETPTLIAGMTDLVDISAGKHHSVALRDDGTVWIWGEYIEWGHERKKFPVPTQVPGISNVVKIFSGYNFDLALCADGSLWAWGINDNGQLGDGTVSSSYTPVRVLNVTNPVGIAAGDEHTVALMADGTVYSWGNNHYGQLGNGMNLDNPVPARISGLTSITQVEAGSSHSLALDSSGAVTAWGSDLFGQLGQSRMLSTRMPTALGYFQ